MPAGPDGVSESIRVDLRPVVLVLVRKVAKETPEIPTERRLATIIGNLVGAWARVRFAYAEQVDRD